MATQSFPLNEIINQATAGNTGGQTIAPTAPGAMQFRDGGQASMVPPAPIPVSRQTPTTTSTSTPVANTATTPLPTMDDIISRFNTIKTGVDKLAAEQTVGQSFSNPTYESMKSYDELYPEIDEDKIRREQLRLFQGQIDSTNQIYDQMLNEARMEGQGRLGSQRAMAARGGLLGSDFGASQKQKVQDYNTDISRAIQAERSAKIGQIMGEVRSSVTAQLAEKRAARQQGAENYLSYLKNESSMRDNNISLAAGALLAQGIDPTTLDENELGAIAMEANLKPQDIIMRYQQLAQAQAAESAEADLKTRKTEAEIAKIDADIARGRLVTLGEGTMLYNTETGEMMKNPKTYKPDAPSGLRLGTQTLDQQSVADVHTELNSTRGQDGYADTGRYMAEFNAFVNLGGDPKDFIKEYDPNVYINPNDPTRSFLQTAMKKPASDNLFLGSLGGLDIASAIAEAETGG